jgi:1-acyl-sn-glycerol-3-phosphate acyltransferase
VTTFLRSALFLIWFFTVTAILSLLCLWVLVSRRATQALARVWSRATFLGLKHIAGIDWEIRGTPPIAPVLVASKHMSMWDTLALWLALPAPAIVLKRELLRIPFYGWFLWRGAAIPIDRGAGASALRKMSARAKAALGEGRQVLIFPEGTRKPPGAAPDYKPGVAALYGQLGVACVPVALNSGAYWRGFTKTPGTIVLEFLEPIPPGLKRDVFMARLQDRIETATATLLP